MKSSILVLHIMFLLWSMGCSRPSSSSTDVKESELQSPIARQPEKGSCAHTVTQAQIDQFMRKSPPEKVAFAFGDDAIKCANGRLAFQTVVFIPAFKFVEPDRTGGATELPEQATSRSMKLKIELSRLSQEEQADVRSKMTGSPTNRVTFVSKFLGCFLFTSRTGNFYSAQIQSIERPDALIEREDAIALNDRVQASAQIVSNFGIKNDLSKLNEDIDLILPHPKNNNVFFRTKKTKGGYFQSIPSDVFTARQLIELIWKHIHGHGLAQPPVESLNALGPIGSFYDLVTLYWPYLGMSPAEAQNEWHDAIVIARELWSQPPGMDISNEEHRSKGTVSISALKFIRIVSPTGGLEPFTNILNSIEDIKLVEGDKEIRFERIWRLKTFPPEASRYFLDFLKRAHQISKGLDWTFAENATRILEWNQEKLELLIRALQWWAKSKGSDSTIDLVASEDRLQDTKHFSSIVSSIHLGVFTEATFESVKAVEERIHKLTADSDTAAFAYFLVMSDHITPNGFEKLAGLAERAYVAGVGPGSLNWAVSKLCFEKFPPEVAEFIVKIVADLKERGFPLYTSVDFFGLREIEKLVLGGVVTPANFDRQILEIASILKDGKRGQQIHNAYSVREALKDRERRAKEPSLRQMGFGIPNALEERYLLRREGIDPFAIRRGPFSCSNLNGGTQ